MKYVPKPIALGIALLLIVGAVGAIEFGPLGAATTTDTPAGGDSAAGGNPAAGASTQTDTPAQTGPPARTAAATTKRTSGDDRGAKSTSESSKSQASGPEKAKSSAPDVLPRAERIDRKSANFSRAPGLKNPTGFINTNGTGVSINDSIGKKVILVDFWAYSCINCKHTQPHFNKWQKEYEDDGLLIVGVHRPEFAFERNRSNVEEAVREANITYPVALDNHGATWNAYGNHYWPHWYLIGVDGYIRYDHIGEGAYKQTDNKIQRLLEERDRVQNATNSESSSVGNRAQASRNR